MDEKKHWEVTERVMLDKTPLTVDIDIQSAWMLVSALQLTTRHPEISDVMKGILTKIARQFQGRIVETHPEAEELLEMGWNEAYDVDEDGDFVNQVVVGGTCSHKNTMIFVSPTTGGCDLACIDCNEYLDSWNGTGDAPDWVPAHLRIFKRDTDDWDFDDPA